MIIELNELYQNKIKNWYWCSTYDYMNCDVSSFLNLQWISK
jgi:hypothetical protein